MLAGGLGVELLGVVVLEEDDDGAGFGALELGLAGVVAGVEDGAGGVLGVVFGAGGRACHAVPPPPNT